MKKKQTKRERNTLKLKENKGICSELMRKYFRLTQQRITQKVKLLFQPV